MKKLFLYAVLGILGWQAYSHFIRSPEAPAEPAEAQAFASEPDEAPQSFSCDGRIYCSQMTSCAEAEYFLENCPGVKMDGGGDGVPCERQWCGNHD
ncbi:MAG: excalibur calcium-binding domain-containing protein [Steroidobacteraceae bacterium]